MNRICCLFILFTSAIVRLSASTEILPPYPIRNHETDFTKQFEYKLCEDHLIYLRSLSGENLRTFIGGDLEPNSKALNWHLFDGLGCPYKNTFLWGKRSLLGEGEFIEEIAVASEILVAVSNENKVFMYKPTVLDRPISWEDELGAPFSEEFYLPADRRAWTFSCSVRDKPKRRVDFMDPSDIVVYYSDMNGVKFDFGFTATIYVLLGDGQRIVYWDTGLPPSFSRGFLTPLKGATQGQSISAAGSTIFISVLDRTNKLRFFSRMYDYEINGGCPGLVYTYQEKLNWEDDIDDKTIPLGFGERKIPLEGWREHSISDIPEGCVTSRVSITLTGQGNSARELRIEGVDSENRSGYYYKMIDHSHWKFQLDERLASSSSSSPAPFPYDCHKLQATKDYEGEDLLDTKVDFQAKLIGFHPFLTAEEPATLKISCGGETTDISLHCVDQWTWVHHNKHHEELIGVEEGEPKSLQATLILIDEQLNCPKDSPLYNVIQEFFLPYHAQVNSLQLVADNHDVFLSSDDEKLKLCFLRDLTQEEIDTSFYIKRARAVTNLKFQTLEECKEILELNKQTLNELTRIKDAYQKDATKFLFGDLLVTLTLPIAKVVFNFEKDDPTYKKAVEDLIDPFKDEVRNQWYNLKRENILFQTAVDILETRISELEKQILDLPN